MFLKKQNKSFKKLFIGIAAFLLSACTTTLTPPPCATPANEKVVIRWGLQNENSTILVGYHLTAQAQLFEIPGPSDPSTEMKELGSVDGEKYCRLAEQVRQRFLKAQAVNVPNPEAAFIEYANPSVGLYWRAVWIPKYSQHTGQQFQQLYDSLQTLIPKE